MQRPRNDRISHAPKKCQGKGNFLEEGFSICQTCRPTRCPRESCAWLPDRGHAPIGASKCWGRWPLTGEKNSFWVAQEMDFEVLFFMCLPENESALKQDILPVLVVSRQNRHLGVSRLLRGQLLIYETFPQFLMRISTIVATIPWCIGCSEPCLPRGWPSRPPRPSPSASRW